MKTKSLMLFLATTLISSHVFANAINGVQNFLGSSSGAGPGGWFLSAGIGVDYPKIDDGWASEGNDSAPDRYLANQVTDPVVGNFALGYLWSQPQAWFPYFGLGLDYTFAAQSKVSGQVQTFATPDQNFYNFSYKFSRQTAMLFGKIDLYNFYNFMPYIWAGIGPSFNQASDYQEEVNPNNPPTLEVENPDGTEQTILNPRVSPNFGKGTNTSLATAVGAGIDYVIYNNLWVSAGYRYGYYGHIQTGNGTEAGGFPNDHLASALRENSLIFSLTYFFHA
ncbi:MAG: outer membrane beta-barrel protein [Gammaproteobacteria bacterium]